MSIYKQYLGSDFEKLHPMMQKRFSISTASGLCMVGKGTMDRIWNGGLHTLPFLSLGTKRNIMFPESGNNIPFTIENYAYTDSYGRETVAWIRQFYFRNVLRNFDATMVLSHEDGRIIDYLGTKQHLAVDISMRVNSNGGLTILSGGQRFYEGGLAFRFPMLFSGTAEVNESYNESNDTFNISVKVSNKAFGPLFGYNGSFKAQFRQISPAQIPDYVKPLREESRE